MSDKEKLSVSLWEYLSFYFIIIKLVHEHPLKAGSDRERLCSLSLSLGKYLPLSLYCCFHCEQLSKPTPVRLTES